MCEDTVVICPVCEGEIIEGEGVESDIGETVHPQCNTPYDEDSGGGYSTSDR
jgi:hypothetical protein